MTSNQSNFTRQQFPPHALLDLPRLGQFLFERGDFGDGGLVSKEGYEITVFLC
jgi:hypothetical protein